MSDPARALTLQLLEWICDRPRRYVDVVDAWRSTCPRLSIWEDACIDGLIDCEPGPDHIVTITDKGRNMLAGLEPGRYSRLSITTGSIGSAGVKPKIFP